MDFVVVGFGLGALIVLGGLAVRIFGPASRPVQRQQPLDAAGLAEAVKRGRMCRGGGSAITTAGALVVLATLLAVVAQAGDDTGDLVVLAAILFGVGLVALWLLVFLNWRRLQPDVERFGARLEARRIIATARRDQRRRDYRRARAATHAERTHVVPRVAEAPEPEIEPGWLPPLPLDDEPLDDDWVPSWNGAKGTGTNGSNSSRRPFPASTGHRRTFH